MTVGWDESIRQPSLAVSSQVRGGGQLRSEVFPFLLGSPSSVGDLGAFGWCRVGYLHWAARRRLAEPKQVWEAALGGLELPPPRGWIHQEQGMGSGAPRRSPASPLPCLRVMASLEQGRTGAPSTSALSKNLSAIQPLA